MSDDRTDAASSQACRVYAFGQFTLDVGREALLHDGQEIRLRPKSFAVLRHLIEHHGRLVTKDELMHVVWAEAFVTEGSLTQCIIDVRRALGSDARQVIRTVARRGYIVDVPVTAAGASGAAPGHGGAPSPPRVSTGRRATVPALLAVAGLLVAALAAWRPGATGPASLADIRSIAVLPFENLSAEPREDYLADGLTEELITQLARFKTLRVVPRTSVMAYEQDRKPLATVAAQLRVGGIIEGSVSRDGTHVRINTKLIRADTGEIMWVERYERSLRDVLILQREVAGRIAEEVGVTVSPEERKRLADARPIDPAAYDQVLLGRFHEGKGTQEGLSQAVTHFERAVALDPASALGHAGLADAYIGLSGFYLDPRAVIPKARAAAQTALQLDDSLAGPHAALGYIHLAYDWDGPAAERELLAALDLNPVLPRARLDYAGYLTTQGRNDEALREVRRAVELDVLSARTHTFAALYLLFVRAYDEAIAVAGRGLQLQPDAAFALAFQGIAYAELGRIEPALDNLRRAVALDNSPTLLALQAHVLAMAGRRDEAINVLKQVEAIERTRYFCPYEIGSAYAVLDEPDAAYLWFRKGADERADCMAWLGVEPWVDPFRSDDRYTELLRRIGLAPTHP